MSEQTNTQNVCPLCGGPGYHVRGCGLQSERDKDREEWIDLMEENQSLRERLTESTEALEKAFETCKNGHGMQTECYGCQRDEARAELERERIAISKYATAARVIALHLKEFCDESLPYDQMVADAARKAASTLASTRQNAQQFAEASSVENSELGGCVDTLTELNNQHCNTIGQLEEQLDTIEGVLMRTEAELNAANRGANEAQAQFQKAKEWNALCELELNNLRSLKDDLEGYLRAVLEHLAPMLKLYEPNMPEHPVIAAIRDYLKKP